MDRRTERLNARGAPATKRDARHAQSLSRIAPALLLLGSLAAGCGGGEGAETGGASPTDVDAVVARLDTVQVRIRSVGSLEADQRVRMSAEAPGRVSEIGFTEGATVRRGEVLLRLDQRKLRAQVEANRAAVNRADREAANLERQVERNRTLLQAGAISEQAFDDLQTRYEAARSRLEEARAQLALAQSRLEDATIRAPFSGRVGAREVDIGTFVDPGDALFIVVDNDPLEIEFTVPERYIGQLEVGSPVELTVSSFPERTFDGRVSFVSPVVDPQNRTVTLKASIPNPRDELRSGQFANVTLQLETKPDAVVVPEQAIVPSGGERYVFLVERGAAVRRTVELGTRSAGRVEVRRGVRAGDTVVVAGQQRLGPGSPVSPRIRDAGSLEELAAEDAAPVPGTEGGAGDTARAETGGGTTPEGVAPGADRDGGPEEEGS